jgi:hypothetical protein
MAMAVSIPATSQSGLPAASATGRSDEWDATMRFETGPPGGAIWIISLAISLEANFSKSPK